MEKLRKQDPVSTMQKARYTNYSSFSSLVWSGKGFHLWIWSLGCSQQLFYKTFNYSFCIGAQHSAVFGPSMSFFCACSLQISTTEIHPQRQRHFGISNPRQDCIWNPHQHHCQLVPRHASLLPRYYRYQWWLWKEPPCLPSGIRNLVKAYID